MINYPWQPSYIGVLRSFDLNTMQIVDNTASGYPEGIIVNLNKCFQLHSNNLLFFHLFITRKSHKKQKCHVCTQCKIGES